jgi:hypothetical protein
MRYFHNPYTRGGKVVIFMDKKEEKKELVEATDSDRRDFLKTAVAAAGALAVAATVGGLAGDEAAPSEPFLREVNTKQLGALKASPVRGTELQMLKGEGQKSLRLKGSQLGNVLKNEGLFMGPDIKDISKVASTLSLSY